MEETTKSNSRIESSEAQTASSGDLAGVAEGHVIETPEGQPNEVVVYDKDEKGDVIGWHKEQVKNG